MRLGSLLRLVPSPAAMRRTTVVNVLLIWATVLMLGANVFLAVMPESCESVMAYMYSLGPVCSGAEPETTVQRCEVYMRYINERELFAQSPLGVELSRRIHEAFAQNCSKVKMGLARLVKLVMMPASAVVINRCVPLPAELRREMSKTVTSCAEKKPWRARY